MCDRVGQNEECELKFLWKDNNEHIKEKQRITHSQKFSDLMMSDMMSYMIIGWLLKEYPFLILQVELELFDLGDFIVCV